MKKRFNTNIEENKLIKLKQIALAKGIGANDLIEEWVDEYLEDGTKKAKSLWKRMGLSTQVPECVLEELEEKRDSLNLELEEIKDSGLIEEQAKLRINLRKAKKDQIISLDLK